MTRQMSAERTRRAVITEAQGQKEAAVTLAEGNRQAAILGAEGERQAAILRAEGLASGLEKISVVGEGLDGNTMQLQYLQTLKDVGASPSTKIVVPMELGGLLNGLRGLLPAEAPNGSTVPGAGRPASDNGSDGSSAAPAELDPAGDPEKSH
jgi:regulator of protease activity HflC (stomatin/prohibitin superfamily)